MARKCKKCAKESFSPCLPLLVLNRVVFSNWVTNTLRLYAEADYIEMESTVGVVPVGDGMGKEVLMRFNTSLNNDQTWYTDSQGLAALSFFLSLSLSLSLSLFSLSLPLLSF